LKKNEKGRRGKKRRERKKEMATWPF